MRSELATAIRRALSGVAVFAQVVMLFTPLVELRDGDSAGARSLAAIAIPGAAISAAQSGHAPPHNPTTCPACIAQSLHAQLESSVRLPTIVVAQRTPADRRVTVLPHHDPPSTHHSRAPPVVS